MKLVKLLKAASPYLRYQLIILEFFWVSIRTRSIAAHQHAPWNENTCSFEKKDSLLSTPKLENEFVIPQSDEISYTCSLLTTPCDQSDPIHTIDKNDLLLERNTSDKLIFRHLLVHWHG